MASLGGGREGRRRKEEDEGGVKVKVRVKVITPYYRDNKSPR